MGCGCSGCIPGPVLDPPGGVWVLGAVLHALGMYDTMQDPGPKDSSVELSLLWRDRQITLNTEINTRRSNTGVDAIPGGRGEVSGNHYESGVLIRAPRPR
jgi:hypothetical protein